MTTNRPLTLAGTIIAATAVAAGAFGAHALRGRVTAEMLAVFETAARYQMYHGLALLAVGLMAGRPQTPQLIWAGWLFVAGTVIFSGSLYALSLSGAGAWGAVTPAGGGLFLAGWICLGWGILRRS